MKSDDVGAPEPIVDPTTEDSSSPSTSDGSAGEASCEVDEAFTGQMYPEPILDAW